MQYQINISIDSRGLTSIYNAQQYVTVVKSVLTATLATGNLPVAWLAFQPLEENQVIWQENYAVYATTTVLEAGASISMGSHIAAQAGMLYTFKQGQFSAKPGLGTAFMVSNQQTPGNFGFGLAQGAIVNGVSTVAPLNAVSVLYDEQASFTPKENISIFLASYSNNGVAISQVAGNALAFTLTSQNPIANVGFDDMTNTFYLSSSADRLASRLVSTSSLARGH